MSKTVLVTGGAGFIGSHVVDRLLCDGHTVVVIDDLSTGRRENLAAGAVFRKGSVAEKGFVEDVFGEYSFDAVIHEASHINTSVPEEDPQLDLSVNVLGTLCLMDAFLGQNKKPGKFIYASSTTVYGSPETLPMAECGSLRPIYSYGIAKHFAEEYVRYYGANRGLDYHVARYGNIYGPRQPIYGKVGVIAIFTDRVLGGKPLTVFGDGEHVRDFLYIDDAVDATVRLLSLPGSDTFNIASGRGTTVNEVVAAFKAVVKGPLEIITKPERPNELSKFEADISRLAGALGWQPRMELVAGIEETIRFYRCEHEQKRFRSRHA